jgi:hypothetical protein
MISSKTICERSVDIIAVVENSVRIRQDMGFIDRHSRVCGNPVFSRENGNPEDFIPPQGGIKTWIPAPFFNGASLKPQE